MNKKVLIIAGDAVEALEVYYPYYRLLEEGIEADIAAPKQKKMHTVIHDFTDWDTYTEKPGYLLESHLAFDEVDPTQYDGVIIPGGRSPEYIRLDENVPALVKHFFEEDKPVGAICHAAQILETIPEALEGRSMTAYIACKPGVEAMGAHYVNENHYVDGNLVSGHAWPDLPDFMREFLKQLNK